MLIVRAVLIVAIIALQGAPTDAATPTASPIPTPSLTPVPTLTPTSSPVLRPTQSVTPGGVAASPTVPEVTSAVTPEQREHWSKQQEYWGSSGTLDLWKLILAAVAAFGGLVALVFTGWRVMILHRQAEEQELASYRERLFSDDPSARIAAAMSLSRHPKEAIWLVNRWAREYKLIQQIEREGIIPSLQSKETQVAKNSYEQVKQAIEDALGIMASQWSRDWKVYWKEQLPELVRQAWGVLRRKKRRSWRVWVKEAGGFISRFSSFRPWFKTVRGPRLDRRRITIDIGPIPLERAYLYKSDLVGVNLQEANLMEANLQNANLREANLQDANLVNANLQDANLWGSNLHKANLREANLQEAYLRDAELRSAKLWDANLHRADLEGSNLQKAKLGNANLQKAGLKRANLKKANLRGVNLQNAYLRGADLQGTELTCAKLQGATLGVANLQEANFEAADLQGANLGSSYVQGTKFGEANLLGASLHDIREWSEIASWSGANIAGVKGPPDGFVEWALSKGAVQMTAEEWEANSAKSREASAQRAQMERLLE